MEIPVKVMIVLAESLVQRWTPNNNDYNSLFITIKITKLFTAK